jgi:hypothetical protein
MRCSPIWALTFLENFLPAFRRPGFGWESALVRASTYVGQHNTETRSHTPVSWVGFDPMTQTTQPLWPACIEITAVKQRSWKCGEQYTNSSEVHQWMCAVTHLEFTLVPIYCKIKYTKLWFESLFDSECETECETVSPNVVVEWLTLLLRSREVPGSNLGPEVDYLGWGFPWPSSVPPSKFRDSTLN